MTDQEVIKYQKVKKIFLLFLVIIFFLAILLFSILNTIFQDRKMPTLNISKKELAIRGNIVSSDKAKVSTTKKLYKVSIDTRYLDKNKKDLFVTLFSIYSGLSYEKILYKVNESLNNPGYVTLSYNIDSRSAKNLKELNYKLINLKVFNYIKNNLVSLEIIESGEKRVYPYKDSLTPVIGYIRKIETANNKTKVQGVKGLEKKFDDLLSQTSDGLIKGSRDAISYIILDKDSVMNKRKDGVNIHLNLSLTLQRNIELITDKYKKIFEANEIIVSVMESKTGKILALASSNRFNPESIKKEDISSLNVKAIEYPFEPGSVIKPISISLALDKDKVSRNQLFKAYNTNGKKNKKGEYPRGKYKIGRYTLGDDHRFKKSYLSIDDIIVNSSNIGTLQIAQKLTGIEFLDGFKKFGFLNKTGIELPYERIGRLPNLKRLSYGDTSNKDNIHRATVSYGQGMTSTFLQVLRAYSVFNNNGYLVNPSLVSHFIAEDNKIQTEKKEQVKVISKQTANEIKNILIKTVMNGTGKSAYIEGLEIGGKTGTAQIARKGKYLKEYISSFFGFVNKNNKSYTIGVTVFNPKYKYHYASQSAVPVFKNIVEVLDRLNYLSFKGVE